MRQDHHKSRIGSFTKKQQRLRFIIKIGLVVMILSLLAGVYYLHSSRSSSASFTQLTDWFKARKEKIHERVVKVKHLTEPSPPPPIHFEFYSAFSNMQVKTTAESSPPSEKNLPTSSTMQTPPAPIPKETQTSKKIQTVPAVVSPLPIVKPAKIFDGEKLAQEFSAHIQGEKKAAKPASSKQYIVQLGVFRLADEAQRYQRVLAKSGWHTDIMVLSSGKQQIYRVQLGPYADQTKAKTIQQQLQQKGIRSIVREPIT